MARTDRILAIDIGATSIKVGEFEYPSSGGVILVNFTHREYEEELTESTRAVVVAGLLRQMVVESHFIARKALVSISGQASFTRFVKLPPFAEDEKRIRQIVEFEAKQNVPFPMEEVIWDYQLIADEEGEDMDVMFVVIKNEIVEQMTGAVQAVGLEPLLVDVAPAACYNAARANQIGEEECAMILNIGGRSTNLLFADGSRFFARTIPIAGHSITQQIGKEFGIGFAEAEELKRRHGFVALGGAYAEPESEVAAAVSKIIRNIMARLHGEINRSISVYRANQKGNRPTKLYLTGGSSTMTYTDHFFSEKLRMEVEYFNPFQVLGLGPNIDRQRLQEVAHMFSEVIGLGLRYKVQCPIEVTLVPENIRRQQALKRKKPYVMGCMACLVLILFVAWRGTEFKSKLYRKTYEEIEEHRNKFEGIKRQIESSQSDADGRVQQYRNVKELLLKRKQWASVLNEIYAIKPDHLWLNSITPIVGPITSVTAQSAPGAGQNGMGMGMGEMGMGMGPEMGMGGGEMGMGMGMGGGGAQVASGSYVEINGLEIAGHSVLMGLSDTFTAASAMKLNSETGEDKKKEEEREKKKKEEKKEKEKEEKDKDGEKEEGDEKKNVIDEDTPGATPEQIFLSRLRRSEMFDESEEFTAFKSYTPPMPTSVRNLASFVIQVKFASPLEYYHLGKTGR